jgi:hypothetical protein
MSTKTGDFAGETKRLADSTGRSVDLAERELEVLSEQARAANAQVEISTQAMRATQQPLLVPVADSPTRDDLRFTARDGGTASPQIGPNAICGSSRRMVPSGLWYRCGISGQAPL